MPRRCRRADDVIATETNYMYTKALERVHVFKQHSERQKRFNLGGGNDIPLYAYQEDCDQKTKIKIIRTPLSALLDGKQLQCQQQQQTTTATTTATKNDDNKKQRRQKTTTTKNNDNKKQRQQKATTTKSNDNNKRFYVYGYCSDTTVLRRCSPTK